MLWVGWTLCWWAVIPVAGLLLGGWLGLLLGIVLQAILLVVVRVWRLRRV
jgi:predicted PurR-regulated permease PerM